MQPRLHTVLFDLDGTLIDSTALILDTYRATALAHGLPEPDDDTLMRAFGTPLRDNLAPWTEDPEEIDALVATYTQINAERHDQMVRAFPGVQEGLQSLVRRGLRLGVVTGKRSRFARRGLEVSGLAPYFRVLVSPEDTAAHKPNPEPVQEGLRQLGSQPEGAAYVGDSPSDIRAGLGAGVQAIAVRWGPLPAEVVAAAGPTRWLEHPLDIGTL